VFSDADRTPSQVYLDRLLASVEGTIGALPDIAYVAETVARRMANGGKLWVTGDPGFVSETCYRAGGMMTAKRLPKPEEVSEGDVVLVGSLFGQSDADRETLEMVAATGAMAVLIGPANPPGDHLFIDVFAPAAGSEDRLPVVSPALTVSLWTFTAELVSALTRLGKMPPMFQSVVVPGGRERNESHLKLEWEPGEVPPVPTITLGRRYLARLGRSIRTLRATQAELLSETGRLAAETLAAGKTVWCAMEGHLPAYQVGQPGDPGVLKALKAGRNAEKVGELVQPGDLVLYIGYYEPFGPWVENTHAAGAKIVTMVSGTPETPAAQMGADINIAGCWAYGDALVEVPEYDVKILPPSGVIAAAAYWMLIAEAQGAMQE